MKKEKRIPPVRYVILFPGRTGSTYLAGHMISHPQICARYEILSRVKSSWEDQLVCMNELFGQKRFPVIRAVGFKSKLSQVIDRKAFKAYLIENEFKIIHQVRNNLLKYIVSVIRAKMLRSEQGRSNVLDHDQRPLGPIEIPVPVFTRATKRLNVVGRLNRFVERLELPKLVISYEDLLKDEPSQLRQVWNFLGVDHIPTEGGTRKNTPDDIREAVTNIDEIIQHHPEMAKFLDD
ncbi:MAG: hypothetical protein AAGA30_15375 [Planctomycetota bacterium]